MRLGITPARYQMKRTHAEANEGEDEYGGGDAAFHADLEEEFTCGICYELLVMPTTLNCGHSFCRHCLAQWFDLGKKTECPSCRQTFAGLPMVNVQMKASLLKLFGKKYTRRKGEVLDDTTNKKAIEDFENILQKRHKDDELSATSVGCVIGLVLALVVMLCLYLAVHWGSSEYDLLVKKPLARWTVDDVLQWVDDIGLDDYQPSFIEHKVNGRMLAEITASDLESMFAMTNPLHQRTFIQALNYTMINGVKQPTNLWEYKALYGGQATFLLYAMGHTPRLALVYLYLYDDEGYEFYKQTVLGCDSEVPQNSTWFYYIGNAIFPHFTIIKFISCYKDLHFWTSRFLIGQCICKGVLDIFTFWSALRRLDNIDFSGTIAEPLLMCLVYYLISCVWWLVPTIAKDALFYAEIYFSPAYYIKEIYNRIRQ